MALVCPGPYSPSESVFDSSPHGALWWGGGGERRVPLRALGDLPEGLESEGWAATGCLGPTFISSCPSGGSCLFCLWSPLQLGARALRTPLSPRTLGFQQQAYV